MKLLSLVALFLFAAASLALGQEALPFPVPEVDPLQELFELIKNWSAITPLGLAMLAVTISVSILKKFVPEFSYKRLAVVVLSVLYGGLGSYASGVGLFDAAIFALISGGGAVAIYEAWKGTKQVVAQIATKASGVK